MPNPILLTTIMQGTTRGPRTFFGHVTLLCDVRQSSAARATIPEQVCAAFSTRPSHNPSSSPLRGCRTSLGTACDRIRTKVKNLALCDPGSELRQRGSRVRRAKINKWDGKHIYTGIYKKLYRVLKFPWYFFLYCTTLTFFLSTMSSVYLCNFFL